MSDSGLNGQALQAWVPGRECVQVEMPGHRTITPEDVTDGILLKALSLAPDHPAGSSTTYGGKGGQAFPVQAPAGSQGP